jgi:nucleoside-diphosphate-sugar epimerase
VQVLIIGGTGFIGKHILRLFAGEGHAVTIFHRGLTTAALPQTVREVVDPKSAMPIQQYPQEILRLKPDVVVHTMLMGEADAQCALDAFTGKTGRLVVLSSGDVYRAYGRFTRIEPGPVEPRLLSEVSPLRSVLFPYRSRASSGSALEYWYDKILVERTVLSSSDLPAIVLRLPKVYGPESNYDLATVYRYRHYPEWCWTHGYVENVAAAVVLAATHPSPPGRIYNVGEERTPTIAERLAWMPHSTIKPDLEAESDFSQNIVYDTSRIRMDLGYSELVNEREALLQTLRSRQSDSV